MIVLIVGDSGISERLVRSICAQDVIVLGKEQDMGILSRRESGLTRLALAIASVMASPVRDILSMPSFNLESAFHPWDGVKDRFSEAARGHRPSHLPVYRAGFAKHHEAVMTRQFRNPVCRSSCNPTHEL